MAFIDQVAMMEIYREIEAWTEDNLRDLPELETDRYEYKSSRLKDHPNYETEFKRKIRVAASAFWNSGGGYLIAGVDDRGKVDGGLPTRIGSQNLRDWVDQVLREVSPTGPYAVQLIPPSQSWTLIHEGHVVLVIGFGASPIAPHMAHDNRYYVRAGAHSNPAGHFLVEALYARRGLNNPLLRGLLKVHQSKANVVELVIVAVNEAPALDVLITFDPFPEIIAQHNAHRFPLKVPIIDRNNAYAMEIAAYSAIRETFGKNPIHLELAYQDLGGRSYAQRQLIDPGSNLSPLRLSTIDKSERSLRDIAKYLKRLTRAVEDNVDTPNGGG